MIKTEIQFLNSSQYIDNYTKKEQQQQEASTATGARAANLGDKLKIVGVGGSMRQASYNTLTLRLALEQTKRYEAVIHARIT